MRTDVVPTFFLYGEAPQAIGDRFLHLEDLDDRTRPSNWNIRPHAHANLNHVFYIADGGGEMQAEAQVIGFSAPCLLLLPAGVIHGFAFQTDTRGAVLTISETYLRELVRREAEFAPLFVTPSRITLPDPAVFADGLERLSRELSWEAPGHAAAVEALLVTLFVEILRLSHVARAGAQPPPGSQAGLVARFRALVEDRYRAAMPVEAFAEQLGVSAKRLRGACLRVTGASPLQIVQDRILLEAKRLLVYSNMTVAEAGYYLGFDDPAYFTRFFSKAAGISPRAFRALGARTEAQPPATVA